MNKYRNVICEYNGIKFDSRKECDRYQTLLLMLKCKVISDLKTQVKFTLIPKNKNGREVKYIADFTYLEKGELIVEDVKGVKTPVYKLKKRLIKEIHGIDIKET